jgi:hypothetical protein
MPTAIWAPGSNEASAVAKIELVVSPSGTANFGSIGVGSSVDQTFTVTNNGATMLHVSASVDAPPDHLASHRRTCCISGSTSYVLPYQAYVEVRSPDSSSCRASRAGGATAAH